MKKSLLMFLLWGTCISVSAQNTREYKGAVIDKNGNPLPGAKVEATGGAENTVTDADGTFTLEASQWLKSITVTYPGMGKERKRVKKTPDNLIVEMNRHPSQWFANLVGGYSFDSYDVFSMGVMGGKKGFWGYYAKFMLDLSKPGSYHDEDDSGIGFTVSFGAIKSLGKNFYLYFGAGCNKGYTTRYNYYSIPYNYSIGENNYTGYNYYSYKEIRHSYGPMADLGVMYTIKNVIHINLGATGRFADEAAPGIEFGVGYCF